MPKFIIKEIDKRKSIGAVAKELEIETHVIRFWETKFSQIKPYIGNGDRRYYFEKDVLLLKKIKHFLYEDGYTIAGLQKILSNPGENAPENMGETTLDKEQDLQKNDQNFKAESIKSVDLSDSKKAEITKIIANIEDKLQKFQELYK